MSSEKTAAGSAGILLQWRAGAREFFGTFAHLSAPSRLALALLPVFLGVVIWEQSYQWALRDDYFFGYFTLPLMLYVLYERWGEIRSTFTGSTATAASFTNDANAAQPSCSPLHPPRFPRLLTALPRLIVIAGVLLFALGAAMRAIGGPNVFATYFNTGGFVALFFATIWLVSERDAAGTPLTTGSRRRLLALLVFPGLVWIVSGPALFLMDTQIKIFLLMNVTKLVAALMNALDLHVGVSANYIILPARLEGGAPDAVGVADACSGVRSLTACIFMGSFLSAIMVHGRWRKIMLVVLSLGLALVLNFIRTTFLSIWAYKYGSASIELDPWGQPPKLPAPPLADGSPAPLLPDGSAPMIENPAFSIGAIHDIAGYVAMAFTFLFLLALIPLVNFHLSALKLRLSDAEAEQRRHHRQR
ncbi:MAG: exosortase/archaeosortase family protein [Opitutaceae bacterium]|jgi:exosortase/archaeosortase family protein|nr:exosortase/archaeosortase family protein [Opitutaceae bacterium]